MDHKTFEETLVALPATSPCMIFNFQELTPTGVCIIRSIWEYPVGWAEMLDENGEPIMYYLQVGPTPPVKAP